MSVRLIGIDDIAKIYDENTILIDMRSQEEYKRFHLEGAVCVPYDDFDSWMAAAPQAPKWILYCQRGNNSLYVAKKLSGTQRCVYTISGGIESRKLSGTG